MFWYPFLLLQLLCSALNIRVWTLHSHLKRLKHTNTSGTAGSQVAHDCSFQNGLGDQRCTIYMGPWRRWCSMVLGIHGPWSLCHMFHGAKKHALVSNRCKNGTPKLLQQVGKLETRVVQIIYIHIYNILWQLQICSSLSAYLGWCPPPQRLHVSLTLKPPTNVTWFIFIPTICRRYPHAKSVGSSIKPSETHVSMPLYIPDFTEKMHFSIADFRDQFLDPIQIPIHFKCWPHHPPLEKPGLGPIHQECSAAACGNESLATTRMARSEPIMGCSWEISWMVCAQ